jgi:DNA-binding NtrC family response regulator
MIMAVASRVPAVKLRCRGKAAGTGLMNGLSDQGFSGAITILLVEDDAPTLWRLQDALAKAGFAVTAAATLAEARASLVAAGPKVLLTDLQLPDGHGIELISETRLRFPDTEIMVISILGDERA